MVQRTNRKDTRPLTVNGELWEYKIGKRCVAIHKPDGKRYFPRIIDIVGERDFNDKSYYLNPATILDHIKVKILGEVGVHKRCCSCNKIKKDVRLQPNPFNAEIKDDYTPHLFCNRCVIEISWEI